MFLLIQTAVAIAEIRKEIFTFQYVSINTETGVTATAEPIFNLHSNMFLLIRNK